MEKKKTKGIERVDPFSDEYRQIVASRSDEHYKELYEEIFETIPTRARAAVAKGYTEYLNKTTRPFLSLMNPLGWINPLSFLENANRILENSVNLYVGSSKYLQDAMVAAGLTEKSSQFFEVGENIAVTPCEVVLETDLLTLKRYIPSGDTVYETPLFMIYSIINAYYILDLTPELSMIRYFVDQGYEVFVTDWKLVTEETKNANFEDYIDEIARAKDFIRRLTGRDEIGGLGYCIGGTFIDIEAALHQGYPYIINLTTLLNSKVGEEGAGLMGAYSDFSIYDIDRFVEQNNGVFPGEVIHRFFDWVKPEKAATMFMDIYFYGQEHRYANDAIYFWNTHSARDLAGPAHRTLLWEVYHENNLARGEMELFGRKVDLANITVPFCNVAALFDHIVPFPNALATAYLIGTPPESQTTLRVHGGHVRGVVNPSLYPLLEEFARRYSGERTRRVEKRAATN